MDPLGVPNLIMSTASMSVKGPILTLRCLVSNLLSSSLISLLSLRVLLSRLSLNLSLRFQSRTMMSLDLSLRFRSRTMMNKTAKLTTSVALKVTSGLRWPTWAASLMMSLVMRLQNRLSSTPLRLWRRCTEHHLTILWLRVNAESKFYELKKIT